MKSLLDHIEYDETAMALDKYIDMCYNGDWLFPSWDGPCINAAMRSAYELKTGEDFQGSMFNYIDPSGDLLCKARWGNINDLSAFAHKLGISIMAYHQDLDYLTRLGSGPCLKGFLFYMTPKHVIPLGPETMSHGLYKLSFNRREMTIVKTDVVC
jgi:hypothetical protein